MKATDDWKPPSDGSDMQYLYSDGEYWHFMQSETLRTGQADAELA